MKTEKYYKDRRNEILKMFREGYTIQSIANKYNLSISSVYRITKNDENYYKKIKKHYITKEHYKNRRSEILKMIIKGFRYQYIADKYGITKQRVSQYAKTNKISRFKNKRKKYKRLVNKIHKYVEYNPYVTLKDIMIKFNLTGMKIYQLNLRNGLKVHGSTILKNRNNNIINDYFNKGLTANEIVNKNYGVNSIMGVYQICYSDNRIRKLRTKKNFKNGYFEKKEILGLIFNLKHNKKMTFEEITKYMNDQEYKTVYGKNFKIGNVKYKYNKAKEVLIKNN